MQDTELISFSIFQFRNNIDTIIVFVAINLKISEFSLMKIVRACMCPQLTLFAISYVNIWKGGKICNLNYIFIYERSILKESNVLLFRWEIGIISQSN